MCSLCEYVCVFCLKCEWCCLFVRVCVPLPGFPVCYCGHNGGRRAGLGRFVWCAVCKRILQSMTLSWPSAVCFSGVCGFKSSSLNYTHWICLKSAAVPPNIIFQHLQCLMLKKKKKNDGQIHCGEFLINSKSLFDSQLLNCFVCLWSFITLKYLFLPQILLFLINKSLSQNHIFCKHTQILDHKIYFALFHYYYTVFCLVQSLPLLFPFLF